MFRKKGVLKIYANFTGKPVLKSLLDKAADLQACTATLLKRYSNTDIFEICETLKSVKFAKLLRTPIWKNICH